MATVNEVRLQAYLDAEAKILRAQSVRSGSGVGGGSEVRRADLEQVRAEIARLQVAVARERAGVPGRGGRFSQADFSR